MAALNVVGLVGKYRRLCVVIFPCYHQRPAEFRGALNVGLPEYVGTAINPVSFAVPVAKYSLFSTRRVVMVSKLRTPNSRRRQVFVDARLEYYIVLLQQRRLAPGFQIQPPTGEPR